MSLSAKDHGLSDSTADRLDRPEKVVDLDELGEREGYILSAELGHADTRHLKLSADGRTILIPQPSTDPNDPLNWSQTKKNLILFVISCTGTVCSFELLP